MIDISQKTILTFDCYGTLIDWESGIIDALQPVLRAHGITIANERLLERFGAHESAIEAGPYMRYADVLGAVLRQLGAELGFTPAADEIARFSRSVENWPAFPDSAAALAQLKQRFKLVILSNIDDDLFAYSNKKLGVTFDAIITAEQVRSYKPRHAHFHEALRRLGVPKEQVLHVAQSLFHDHVPAQELGFTTVWIHRRHNRQGFGATPFAEVQPDLTLPDLQSLADFERQDLTGLPARV